MLLLYARVCVCVCMYFTLRPVSQFYFRANERSSNSSCTVIRNCKHTNTSLNVSAQECSHFKTQEHVCALTLWDGSRSTRLCKAVTHSDRAETHIHKSLCRSRQWSPSTQHPTNTSSQQQIHTLEKQPETHNHIIISNEILKTDTISYTHNL